MVVSVGVEVARGQGIDDAGGTMILMVALVSSGLKAICRRLAESGSVGVRLRKHQHSSTPDLVSQAVGPEVEMWWSNLRWFCCLLLPAAAAALGSTIPT